MLQYYLKRFHTDLYINTVSKSAFTKDQDFGTQMFQFITPYIRVQWNYNRNEGHLERKGTNITHKVEDNIERE